MRFAMTLFFLVACGGRGSTPDPIDAAIDVAMASCTDPDTFAPEWNPSLCVCRLGRTRCVGNEVVACCLSDSLPPYDATSGLPGDCSPQSVSDDSRFEPLTTTLMLGPGPIVACGGQPLCGSMGTCVDDGSEPVRCTCVADATCRPITCTGGAQYMITVACDVNGAPVYTRC
jgi:hypothetical protein